MQVYQAMKPTYVKIPVPVSGLDREEILFDGMDRARGSGCGIVAAMIGRTYAGNIVWNSPIGEN
jgi:hypothetical protein